MRIEVTSQDFLDRAVAISTEQDMGLCEALSVAIGEIDAQVHKAMSDAKIAASTRLDLCVDNHNINEARRILTETGRKLRSEAA